MTEMICILNPKVDPNLEINPQKKIIVCCRCGKSGHVEKNCHMIIKDADTLIANGLSKCPMQSTKVCWWCIHHHSTLENRQSHICETW